MSLKVGRQVGSGYQLVGSGPEAYEAYLVPPLFEPCAEQLLAAVDVGLGESVVDVACGTGGGRTPGRRAGRAGGSCRRRGRQPGHGRGGGTGGAGGGLAGR